MSVTAAWRNTEFRGAKRFEQCVTETKQERHLAFQIHLFVTKLIGT